MSEISSRASELMGATQGLPGLISSMRHGLRRMAGMLLLASADATALVFVLAFVSAFSGSLLGSEPSYGGVEPGLWAMIALTALIACACLGLYEITGRNAVERFRLRVWCALVQPVPGLLILASFRPIDVQALQMLLLTSILWLPLAMLAEALVVRWLIGRSAWGLRALLVGDAVATLPLAKFLLANPEIGLNPVGYCGNAGSSDEIPVSWLGPAASAMSMGNAADIAIVALSSSLAPLELSSLPFRRILVMPEMTGLPSLWLRSCHVGRGTALEFYNPLQAPLNLWAKRVLDICVSVPLLVVSAPIVGFLALAIRIVSPGPAFYTQRRVGWNGKPLDMLKLRSMHLDAEVRLKDVLVSDPVAQAEWARCFKLSNDPRILPVIGNFIRKTSLDELPQLWNVARGDMSLVGPRPFPAYHLEMFDPEFQALRCSVRPGLTGLWQVSERSDADLRQQQMLDTFYIRNWSLWFDLYIALVTIPAVLSSKGAR